MRLGLALLLAAATLLLASGAGAEAVPATTPARAAGSADWAAAWLNLLFHGPDAADSAAGTPLAALAEALRGILGACSTALFVIGGIVLLYHVAAMVAETAHSGSVLGRRVHQIWGPVRLALAITLLVPLGGGLGLGQHLVLRLAEGGSRLASEAWQATVETIQPRLAGFAAPLPPDTRRLTAVALEMELCRALYRRVAESLQPDPVIRAAGDMPEPARLPRQKLAPESWRFTNKLHADLPLCGEYRFPPSPVGDAGPDSTLRAAGDLAAFARADAERLMGQFRPLAESLSVLFLTGAPTPGFDGGIQLPPLVKDQEQALAGKLKTLAADGLPALERRLRETLDTGWITAGAWPAEILRLQALYGSLAGNAVPVAQAPLFGHRALTPDLVTEALAADPALRALPAVQTERLYALYDKTSLAMKRARAWLHAQQMEKGDPTAPDTFDLQDRLTVAADGEAGLGLLNRVALGGSVAFGLGPEGAWSASASVAPLVAALTRDAPRAPFAALAELGRRNLAFGGWVWSFSGVESAAGARGTLALFAVVGGLYLAAGAALLFLLPLIPLFRFVMATLVWLLAVLEALAALPLVALAHLTPYGDGLSGGVARQAYWLVLAVFLRPALIVVGFVAGFAFFALGIAALSLLFARLFGGLSGLPGETVMPLWAALTLLYAALACAVANAAFKGITFLPEFALRWMGGNLPSDTVNPVATAPAAPVAGGGNGGVSVALTALPGAASGLVAGTASLGGPGGATGESRLPATRRGALEGPDKADHLRAALFPATREPLVPGAHLPMADAKAQAVAQTSGAGASRAGAAASASGEGGASASASAEAVAVSVAMAQQLPADSRSAPPMPPIVREAQKLGKLLETTRDKPAGPAPEEPKEGKTGKESPAQETPSRPTGEDTPS